MTFPAGISALDIRTRLRITEAELAIVQRELSDLQLERNLLEASSRQYEESWRYGCGFEICRCGFRNRELDVWVWFRYNVRSSIY